MPSPARRRLGVLGPLALLVLATACAAPPPATAPRPAPTAAAAPASPSGSQRDLDRAAVVRAARSALGTPYRYGGSSRRGFDCSGLVVWSYARAGVSGLPHSAAALQRLAEPVSIDALQPGDLLFFRLGRSKISHVGIYAGSRSFIHAPKTGGRVEQVPFDHVYWGDRLRLAGRISSRI